MAATATKKATLAKGGSLSEENKSKSSKTSIPVTYKVSVPTGIVVLIICLVLSLFVGNFRALQKATPKEFSRWGDVASIVEQRIVSAGNALRVANRVGLNNAIAADLDDAIQALKAAKSAQQISRANQALTVSVSDLVDEIEGKLDAEGQKMLQNAVDDFTEYGSFLRQEGKSYNEKAEKAKTLYEKLPTRFLLKEPSTYEGL